jgi:His-Xaa-Ser system protein HxsD
MEQIDNFELDKKQNLALISVNPKVFPLPVIFSASYWMMDKAFVVIDGSPSQIVVSLRPKAKQNLEELARLFNEELINNAVNASESKKTEALRNELIKLAFAGHSKK